MAGRIVPAVHATVTAATAAGVLTVASATGLYVGAKAWLSNTAGTVQDLVEIVAINATAISVRKNVNLSSASLGPNYGLSDVSAYNGGGFLDQLDQLIYNRQDAPAP
jgi:hypothetical protein